MSLCEKRFHCPTLHESGVCGWKLYGSDGREYFIEECRITVLRHVQVKYLIEQSAKLYPEFAAKIVSYMRKHPVFIAQVDSRLLVSGKHWHEFLLDHLVEEENRQGHPLWRIAAIRGLRNLNAEDEESLFSSEK